MFFQACFLPGTVALGLHHGLPDENNELLKFAEELAYTCYLTFARQPTHLAAEITYFNYEKGIMSHIFSNLMYPLILQKGKKNGLKHFQTFFQDLKRIFM